MKFLVDRCAGHRLAQWLRDKGHDVVESAKQGEDPGDEAILEWAASEQRILITMDKDFGELVFKEGFAHGGPLAVAGCSRGTAYRSHAAAAPRTSVRTRGWCAVATVRGDRVRVSLPDEEI